MSASSMEGRVFALWTVLGLMGAGCRGLPSAGEPDPGPSTEGSVASRVGDRAESFFDWSELQFAPEVHRARREALMRALRAEGGGVYLAPAAPGHSHGGTFRQLDDFLYFTGLELPDSVLALDADRGEAHIFAPDTDARFQSASRPNDFPGRPLALDADIERRSGLELTGFGAFDAALEEWAEAGRTLWVDAGRVWPEADSLHPLHAPERPQALVASLRRRDPRLAPRDAHPHVARLRMVKSPEEVERIRRACRITMDGIRAAAAQVRPGVDERTLEAELEAAFKRGGSQRLAFDSIIKSGPNSLWPWRILAAHYDRRNRSMAAGELVIFDVGCELDHYASDVGRTFPVSGTFTPRQRELLEMITAAADAVHAAVRPGTTFAELRAVAHGHVPASERAYMQTGLFFGHHIGLDVGDASLGDAPLEPGMVFTVEPWYYNHDEGVAVFVEDVILVTEEGHENLTRELPRSAERLESLMVGGG